MRLQRVVELDARRMEIPVFRDDVMVRVAGELEAGIVREARRVGEAPVPEERAREQLGLAAVPRLALREPVTPAEVGESVHVLLVVVDNSICRVEWHGEAGA